MIHLNDMFITPQILIKYNLPIIILIVYSGISLGRTQFISMPTDYL